MKAFSNLEVEKINKRLERLVAPFKRSIAKLEEEIEILLEGMKRKALLGEDTLPEEFKIRELKQKIDQIRNDKLFKVYLEGDIKAKRDAVEKHELSEAIYQKHEELEQIKKQIEVALNTELSIDIEKLKKEIQEIIKELKKLYKSYDDIINDKDYRDKVNRLKEFHRCRITRPSLPYLTRGSIINILLSKTIRRLNEEIPDIKLKA